MKKVLLLCFLALNSFTIAQYQLDTLSNFYVGPGVNYTHIVEPKMPWSVHVLRIEMKNPALKFEVVKSGDNIKGTLETVNAFSKRKTYDGHYVVGAVNGDFFVAGNRTNQTSVVDGEILQNEIRDANYATVAFNNMGGVEFAYPKFVSSIISNNGKTYPISDINQSPVEDRMVMFNSYFGTSTLTDNAGAEAVLKPLGEWYMNDTVYCVVDSVLMGSGNAPIMLKNMVLSGRLGAGEFIKANLHKGDTVRVAQRITSDLYRLKELMGGHPFFVKNGELAPIDPNDPLLKDRHPRTIIARDKDTNYVYLIVVDGRQVGLSAGMNVWEMTDFMKMINVYEAMNTDGGGSTAMVVRNATINSPSSIRPVGSSLMVISNVQTSELNEVILYPQKKNVFRGEKLSFKVAGSDKNHMPIVLNQSQMQFSCDQQIGEIDNNGLFTAALRNSGTGRIYVKYGDYTDTSYIVFKPVGAIKLSPKKIVTDTIRSVAMKLEVFDSYNIPQSLPLAELKWSLSNPAVGIVDASGSFKGKTEGITKLIGEYQGVSDTVEIKVEIGRDEVILEQMEDSTQWKLDGQGLTLDNSKISVVQDVKSSGNGALKIDYEYVYSGVGTKKVYLEAVKPIPVYGVPDTVKIDAKSDNFTHRVYVIVSNSNDELFRANANKYMNNAERFDVITVPLKTFTPLTSGIIDFPMKINRIEIQLGGTGRVEGQTYKGTLYLDNLRVRYPLQTTDIVSDDEENTPSAYSLSQNYPNPFNPSTIIEFNLPEVGLVDLRIYDLLGREVAVLANTFMQTGTHRIEWNASGMPSGIYFYKLQSGSYSKIRKMILLR